MQLALGSRLGPYEILAPLGAGGMGEVYKALDTRLGRAVAIKVSAEQFGSRFAREARAISALNHPNICTLHDVGPNYLVMELVAGETLAARIKKGKLTLDETLRYGAQIADALAAAHAKAITHRDLKPANVMLAKSGVKVLDFGLAITLDDETITATNEVVGTPAYMAPEQRAGKLPDARTDIYALGLILYEMATGKRQSEDQPSPLSSMPTQLAHVVERCLEKDPSERWQAASDVGKELEWAAKVQPTRQVAPVSSKARLAWAIAALTGVAIFGYVAGRTVRRPNSEDLLQFGLPVDYTAYADMPRVAPDGSAVVYPAVDLFGRRQLWLRSIKSVDARSLAGTNDALFAFWSPDARWIGFYSHGKLMKVSLDGGGPQRIAALDAFDGTAAWSSTGEILYAPGNRSPLYRIRDSGGLPQQVTKLDESLGENSHRFVRFLPDGKRFLFVARCANRENNGLYSGTLDSGDVRRVGPIQSNVAYVAGSEGRTASLLFAREGVLYQQAFDGTSFSGEPRRLTDVGYRSVSMLGFFDVSTDGRVLVLRRPSSIEQRLTWFDRKGARIGELGLTGEFNVPRISPDGSRVIFNRPDDKGGNRDVWLIEIGRGIAARLTTDLANEWGQLWSPDGASILFASDRMGHVYGSTFKKTSMDPGAGEKRMEELPEWANPADWSRDGKWIVFVNGERHGDIWIAPTFGDKKPFRFFDSGFEDRDPRFSADGKWISYHSNESGRFEVYVRPFAGTPAESGRKIQISLDGGFNATWGPDGKELFFLSNDSKMYVTPVKNLDQVARAIPAPQPLFRVCPGSNPRGSATEGRSFDIAPDGQKFLFVCNAEPQSNYVVTVGWQAGQ